MGKTITAVQNMYSHFAKISSVYRQIRSTDVEPIAFIGETLKNLPEVKAADVGCGDGRYNLLLFQHLNNLLLTCIDINESMLEQVKKRHYSTFSLYKKDELSAALKTFQENIRSAFKDTTRIEWFDENILLILKVK